MPATKSKVWNSRNYGGHRWEVRDRLKLEGRLDEFVGRLRELAPERVRSYPPGKLIQNIHADIWYLLLDEYPPLSASEVERLRWVPTEEWPFWVPKPESEDELRDGASRDSVYADDVQWVGLNIGNKSARPAEAPSNAAWQMLLNASLNPTARKDFYRYHFKPVMEKKAAGENEAVQRRSEVKQFDLIDQFAGWKECPHCGEGL